jgi:metal-responsive CopG/Arc/MetJ family transcriptional regulator
MNKFESRYIKITISVPADVVEEVDRIAKLESRTRSGQMTFFMNDEISHNGAYSHNVVD